MARAGRSGAALPDFGSSGSLRRVDHPLPALCGPGRVECAAQRCPLAGALAPVGSAPWQHPGAAAGLNGPRWGHRQAHHRQHRGMAPIKQDSHEGRIPIKTQGELGEVVGADRKAIEALGKGRRSTLASRPRSGASNRTAAGLAQRGGPHPYPRRDWPKRDQDGGVERGRILP